MLSTLIGWYKAIVIRFPVYTLIAVTLLTGYLAWSIPDFRLDASADSLVLEHDKALSYYRTIRARYGSDDFLVVTYTPKGDLFAEQTRNDVKQLRDELAKIKRVESVTSYLDVPLISSPRITFAELRRQTRTLEKGNVDIALARKEFHDSPLYRNLIVSPDGTTTALQVNFKRDQRYHELLNERNRLRDLALERTLSAQEKNRLKQVSREFKLYSEQFIDQEHADIATVRTILDKYRDKAELHLGGVPMITADMIDYIQNDIQVFGIGVLCFIIIILAVSFHQPRWVVLPMIICAMAVIGMVGYLGLVQWRVTVVSSNFISLLLIITLSLTIHLIVRYLELRNLEPDGDHREMTWETMRSKFLPSLYTALTTMVAFGSLLVSGIRPVIDFGWMMVVGIALAFVLAFLIFPAGLVLLKPRKAFTRHLDVTGKVIHYLADFIHRHSGKTLLLFIALALLGLMGIKQLTVENRFIDYFKQSTEIYQGMVMIDRELGGTTPLDVIIDPDKDFLAMQEEEKKTAAEEGESADDFEQGAAGISGTSYWFNVFQLQTVKKIQQYLESLPETGKVLSMDTTMSMLTQLNDDKELSNIILSVMYKRLPPDIKKILFDPYMSSDGNQVRFAIRVYDSNKALNRDALLHKIRHDLTTKFGLQPQQVKLTGMLVLYDNMLQSLFRSQILTLGVVFFAIMLMFMVLFRSIKISVLAIIPNLIAAGMVLGLMGWLGIPLDIMTITIAAITIGIGVDDTIHYIHRFMEEFVQDRDYWATVKRCHKSIGRAMYYTSITITLGFSILALSNFIPTIYFGLLTGFAMMSALAANLTLLPVLIARFKPLGSETETA